jgi:FkbM family methyltransferase
LLRIATFAAFKKRMIKSIIRKLLIYAGLDLTPNLRYDRLARKVVEKILSSGSVCIDAGCHKGEFLDLIRIHAPGVKHYAFEPIPEFIDFLINRYGSRVHIFPFALGDREGVTEFHHVKNAPAYSGILKRKYKVDNPEIEKIQVKITTLDEVIPAAEKIDLIKIDVEGAEFDVLKGARKLLLDQKPFVIFEYGLGASDYYGTKPEEIFDFLTQEVKLNISLMDHWLENKNSLEREEFCRIYHSGSEYYFLAHP